jgi:DNA ligase D-like protein (predicted 3'-phosphoesterase)
VPSRNQDLQTYREKRNLARSGEPLGRRRRPTKRPRFVVQHHLASTDHYDFRLEVDGVLKSWAVPKGPSTNPKERRMARPTEDHPVEYATFEGVIPEGEYGAGTVLVWDTGHYENRSEADGEPVAIDDALDRGHVSFELEGEKLHGGYALTRIRGGRTESWLLVKKADEHTQARGQPTRTRPESALTGRTVEDIEADATRPRRGRGRRS